MQYSLAMLVALWCLRSVVPTHAADYWVDAQSALRGNADGSRGKPFKTIQEAARMAQPGDTVHVLPGVYRERVMPPRGGKRDRPIVYVSQERHGAIVKGSDLWTPQWRHDADHLFSAELDDALFTDTGYVDGGNPYRIAYDWDKERHHLPPYPHKAVQWTLGQVFVDGVPLAETSSRDEVSRLSQSWWYDAASNRIVVNLGGSSPDVHAVELTTRRGVFRSSVKGLGYIELRGFVFEHCANQFPAQFWRLERNAQSGMVGTRGGHHWIIADNIIRHAKSIGLSFGASRGGRPGDLFDNERPAQADPTRVVTGFHRITGNLFQSNGALGAMGCNHTDVVFEDNVFVGNNALRNTAYEVGGIKTHQAYGLRVERNWFLDNECMGVWLDNTWHHCRVTRNVFIGNRGKSLFLEMDDNTSDTASLVDCNIFLDGRPRLTPGGPPDESTTRPTRPWVAGIYGHDADGVRIVRNLIAGEGYGLYFRKITDRKGGAAHILATGNLFAGKDLTAVCLPVEHPPYVQGNHFDFNVYPGLSEERRFAATTWSQPNGGSDRDRLERLRTFLGKGTTTPVPFADPERPPSGFRLNLAEWQQVMQFDQHSVSTMLDYEFDRKTWTLTLKFPTDAARVAPRPEPNVRTDFFGQPLDQSAAAGPFAQLRPGTQQIQLPKPPRIKTLYCPSSLKSSCLHLPAVSAEGNATKAPEE